MKGFFKKTILLFISLYGLFVFTTNTAFAYTFSPQNPTTTFSGSTIYSIELQDDLYIIPPTLEKEFFVISDENENFYLPTTKGFAKFSSSGEFLYKTNLSNTYMQFSNLLYSDGRVILLTKKWPGYLLVLNSDNGEVLNQHKLFNESDRPGDITKFSFSDISISNDGNFVYFASHVPSFVFSVNLQTNAFSSFDLSEQHAVFNGGNHILNPQVVDGNKFLFVSNKNTLHLFDKNNISNYVFTAGFNNQNSYLNQYSSGGFVPSTATNNYFFTIFNRYICSFKKVDGVNNICNEYINTLDREKVELTNLVSLNDDNFALFFSKTTPQGYKTNFISSYNSNLGKNWQVEAVNVERAGVFIDGNKNIIAGGSSVYKISEQGEVLGAYSVKTPDQFKLFRGSLITPTVNGNYYYFAQYKNSKNHSKSYIYKYKGDTIEPKCVLGFYCTTTPKHRPVILIHGLGGSYLSFFNGQNAILREAILNNFTKDDKEFPSHWVHAYSYGYDFAGNYNYQGKINDITKNLHFVVEELANEHKLAGGDGKVDIIGYSLGGLVARHYVLQKTGYPGEQNLNVDTKVKKIIFVASPVNGSSGYSFFQELEKNYPFVGVKVMNQMENVLSLGSGVGIDLSKGIGNELSSSSPYINSVGSYSIPPSIELYRSYSNIQLEFISVLFHKKITKRLDLGDLTVLPGDTHLDTGYIYSYYDNPAFSLVIGVNKGELELIGDFGLSDNYHWNYLTSPNNINFLLESIKYEEE